MQAPEGIPQIGEVVAGKYQIEEVLGQGGMGVVMAARHIALKQRVAIKFLLPATVKLPEAAARFLREAQAAGAIQSEHVARVLDVGTLANGLPYMVMEHLTGVNLSRHLKMTGPLPMEDAIDFILQASEGVVEAHALGIVHRDLKPGNLFLTRRSEGSPLVKVLDFGLSKMVLGDEPMSEGSLTKTDVVVGSPHYMSPEQVRSLKHVDARSDVWAMGVILYELLTVRRPFEGHTMTAICAAVVADTPIPPRSFRQEIPEQMEALILRCLEKDRERRLASVAHLAQGLAQFASARAAAQVERISRIFSQSASGSKPRADDTAVTNLMALRAARAAAGAPEIGETPPPATAGTLSPFSRSIPSSPSAARANSGPVEAASSSDLSETATLQLPREDSVPDVGRLTGIGWGNTQQAARSRRGARMAVALASATLVVAAGVATWLLVFHQPADPLVPSAAERSAAAAATMDTPSPALLPAPEPATSSSPPPASATAPPTSSASSTSPAPSVTSAPPAAVTTAPEPIAVAAPPQTAAPRATAVRAPARSNPPAPPRPAALKPSGPKKSNPLDRSD